jgi:hypothetical protein
MFALKKALEHATETRFHDGMDQPMSVLPHEYGHQADGAMQRETTSSAGAGDMWSQNKGSSLVHSGQYGSAGNRLLNPVTRYAATNEREWFAESFAFAVAVRGYGDAQAKQASGVGKMRPAVESHFSPKRKT